MRYPIAHVAVFLLFTVAPMAAQADEATLTVSLNTVWIATAAALVFFMQAGFALLESGASRSKNAVNVIMKNYTDVCVGSLVFWMLGYGLMFGTNTSGWIGADHFFLNTAESGDYLVLLFQTMFAATAVTIASGAMAERTSFLGYLLGAIGITAVIYPVYGSWAWGSGYEGAGWLKQLGFIDFAGSTVVHSIGGWCALAGIVVLGPRMGRFSDKGEAREIPGHNLMFVALGGFILWVGWFGFNGGSTLMASADIGLINLNTQLSAAAGAVSVVLLSLILGKPVLASNTINGSLAGLVGITAGCASMTPLYAVITGLGSGFVFVLGINALESFKLDDVVNAVSVHGFCGAWGTLAAGLFLQGNMFSPTQVAVQLIGIAAAFIWAVPVALLMYWFIEQLVGLRVSSTDERRGLDYTEHYELGYPEFQTQKLHNK